MIDKSLTPEQAARREIEIEEACQRRFTLLRERFREAELARDRFEDLAEEHAARAGRISRRVHLVLDEVGCPRRGEIDIFMEPHRRGTWEWRILYLGKQLRALTDMEENDGTEAS